MSRQCEIVRDLLPLYVDGICSEASRELVKSHLPGCPECTEILEKMGNGFVEAELISEKADVIGKRNRIFKRKSALLGLIIGCIMMIPVIICLIVAIAGGIHINTLAVVLTALMLGASLTVVPLVFPENKFLWTLGLGTLSLILLFAASIIPAAGIEFFLVALTSTVFGLSVVFAPIAVNRKALKEHLGNFKGLTAMSFITVWFILMMLSIRLITVYPDYARIALPISAVHLGVVWLIFIVIRYLKISALIRAGLCSAILALLLFAENYIISTIMNAEARWPEFNPSLWNDYTINENIEWILLIAGCVLGCILIVAGIVRTISRKRKKEV